MKMEKKLILPIMALLLMSLVVSTASAGGGCGWYTVTYDFAVTARGLVWHKTHLDGSVSGSGSGTFTALFNPSGDLRKLWVTFESGSVKALWYESTTRWHRMTQDLAGAKAEWNYWDGEIPPGTLETSTWTVTGLNPTVSLTINPTTGKISGTVVLVLSGVSSSTLRITGTFTQEP
jgi:hypothetical protein